MSVYCLCTACNERASKQLALPLPKFLLWGGADFGKFLPMLPTSCPIIHTWLLTQVGYILGLGDRHPSNLMLDRYSGKLLHIDFGDCFEASMTREKFPEKVEERG